jgi:hypothetical protein
VSVSPALGGVTGGAFASAECAHTWHTRDTHVNYKHTKVDCFKFPPHTSATSAQVLDRNSCMWRITQLSFSIKSVAQADLKLLSSTDPHASGSYVATTSDMRHHAQMWLCTTMPRCDYAPPCPDVTMHHHVQLWLCTTMSSCDYAPPCPDVTMHHHAQTWLCTTMPRCDLYKRKACEVSSLIKPLLMPSGENKTITSISKPALIQNKLY